MTEIRCKYCNKFLLKARVIDGEIKCRGCKKINVVQIVDSKTFPIDVMKKI